MYKEDEWRRMIYNNRDLIEKGRNQKEKEKRRGKRLLGGERSWEFPSSAEESFLPKTKGRLILCS